MILDTLWWDGINYKKAEKGLEFLEHYHFGLIMLIGAIVVYASNIELYLFLTGVGLFFLAAEWAQGIVVLNKKVVPGHRFAYQSKHFVASTAIGTVLVVILVSLIFIYGMWG
jgi:hypothetical protein